MKKIDEMIKQLCPNGVEYKQLGDICNIKGRIGFRGYTRKDQVNEGEGALSLSPGNIVDGQMDYTKGTYITWAKYDESPEIMTYNGDIIFCKTASVGKVALVKNLPCKATINPQLVVLKEIKCNASFLAYILETDKVQNKVISMAGVGSVPNISQKALSEIEIPLPPLSIQKEIVSVLDKFSELIEKTDEEIALRQKQYEYYREKLLTFEEGEAEWKSAKDITEVTDYVANGSFADLRNNVQYLAIPDYAILVRTTDLAQNFAGNLVYINQDAYNFLKKSQLFGGEIIINNIGAGVGQTFICPNRKEKMNLGPNSIMVKTKYNKFYYYWLSSKQGQESLNKIISPGAMPKFNKTGFKTIMLPVPSPSRQQDIVDKLDKFEALISKLKEERELRQKQYEYYREKLLTF